MEKLPDDEIRVLIAEKNALRERGNWLIAQSIDLGNQIESQCMHSEIEKGRKYYPGGYDYVSVVVVTDKCKLCGRLRQRLHGRPTRRRAATRGSHD